MEINEKWRQVEPAIGEVVEKLNRTKRANRRNAFFYGTLMGLVVGLIFSAGIGPFALFAVPVAWLFFLLYSHTKCNREYKRTVVPKLVDAICPGATYNPQGDFPKETIRDSNLYPAGWGEHYKQEDTIRGKVGSTDFVYSELRLSHTQSNGKTTTEVVDFKGFAFEADFNKHFQGHTLLSTERVRLMGRIGLFSNYQRIRLEDVFFDEHYRTYATNDQEARYILTPALQHRIMQMEQILSRECGARELSMSFKGGRLLIMVQSFADRFEVKYDLEKVKSDFIAFCILVDIVEQLNLNLRIWTKE